MLHLITFTRERIGVVPIVEKMVKIRLRWFEHVERRPVDYVVWRVDQTEGSQITRGKESPRKTTRETIMKYLEINELKIDMLYDRTLWCRLINVVDLI